MNERIRQLIEDSGLHIAYENKAVTEKELEFFAESIIQECLNMCDWQTDQRIQQHFKYRDNRWPETEQNPRPF